MQSGHYTVLQPIGVGCMPGYKQQDMVRDLALAEHQNTIISTFCSKCGRDMLADQGEKDPVCFECEQEGFTDV